MADVKKFLAALEPVLIQLFAEGKVKLCPYSHWSFEIATEAGDCDFEDEVVKRSGVEIPDFYLNNTQELFEAECKRVADLIRSYPLLKALE